MALEHHQILGQPRNHMGSAGSWGCIQLVLNQMLQCDESLALAALAYALLRWLMRYWPRQP